MDLPDSPASLGCRWDVEREGEVGYVLEYGFYPTHIGPNGSHTRFGPMPRDMLGPFIDERQEYIQNITGKLLGIARGLCR